jgi:energy-coupling factor transporter ATP-binding protein EcfA2
MRGFRSIVDQEVELRPLTLVYGPNGSGKSSLLYALLVLKNLLLNPNQPLASLFNLGFLNLGGFRDVVHRRDPSSVLGLSLGLPREWDEGDTRLHWQGVLLREGAVAEFTYRLLGDGDDRTFVEERLETSLPYPGQSSRRLSLPGMVPLLWNGLAWMPESPPPPELADATREALVHLNAPLEALRRVAFVPIARGFAQPQYQPASFIGLASREEEVATILAQDPELELKVSLYLEEIAERQLRVRTQVGTALFSLWVGEPSSKEVHLIVNEGFGINQLVYLLALALHRDTETLLVEEPEIHLHPSLVRRLARGLARIARQEGKRFLLSTHSEALVTAVLALVARGELRPDEVACYLAEKRDGVTRFQEQRVNEQGQVEGGLLSFMAGELEDLRAFLGVQEET